MNHLQQISELQPYYQNDSNHFHQLILSFYSDYQQLSHRSLLHLSTLRSIEICNGIVQWSYRLQKHDALPIEQTRECMKLSLSIMNQKKIHNVPIDSQLIPYMKLLRKYYNEGVKHHQEESMMLFYAHSTAQFLAIPIHMIFDSFKFMHNNYEYLFTSAYLSYMRKYVLRYYSIVI